MDLEDSESKRNTDSEQIKLAIPKMTKDSIFERYKSLGISALTDQELLVVTLFKGKDGKSSAASLLERYSHLHELYAVDTAVLETIPGVGPKTSMRIEALLEMTRRMIPKPHESHPIIKQPADVANYYIARLRCEMQERFLVLLLNSANRLIKEVFVSLGTLNASMVHPREVFRTAISNSAASIILVHNHPSGNPEPSREDIAVTKQIREAGNILEIKLLDHIIIAGEQFTSFSERGLM